MTIRQKIRIFIIHSLTMRHPVQCTKLTAFMTRGCFFGHLGKGTSHRLINHKDTKTKSRLYWCLIEFIVWRYSQSCWYFRPSFVNFCPSNLLSRSPLPPPPFPKSKYSIYRQCVAGSRWGMLSCVGDHNRQELTLCI